MGVKYKLNEYDLNLIKFIEDEYNIRPSFNEKGFYTFDLKPNPSFKNAKMRNYEMEDKKP